MAEVPLFRPQLATLVERPPSGPEWLHELKLDGYRIACSIENGSARLQSRRNRSWTAEFPEVVAAAQRLPVRSALLDGEVAIVVPSGLTSFQALQNAFSGAPRHGLTYFAFDLIHLDGRNIGALPLEQRKKACEQLIAQLDGESARLIRYSQHFDVDGASLLEQACALGAEGIISKRRDQSYRPGRNDGWLKTKCSKRQEFVIGGFTDPGGSRSGIGALLVGYFEAGELRFAGKVGTGPGFTQEYLARVRLELATIEQAQCPFRPPPPGWLGRHAHWVRPVRTGDVVFTEWTDAGTLRHPSFQGFHDDSKRPAPLGGLPAPARHPTGARTAPAVPPRPSSRPLPSAPSRTSASPTGSQTVISGVAISSPERAVYTELDFSKQDLAQFYAQIAQWMLPYIANRPLTLVRCERSIRSVDALRNACRFLPHEEAWYRWAQPPIRRIHLQEQKKIGEYLLVDSPEGLVALVQGDIVEIHVWNSTADRPEHPDRIVLDLDPGDGVPWSRVVDSSFLIRDLLQELGLQCWPKLTGGRGVHVVLPFEPEHGWDQIYALSRCIAEAALQRDPEGFTLDFAKTARAHKILIDYKRNHRGAVAVAAYSTRAHPNGAVGIPLSWRELRASRTPNRWTVKNLLHRLRRLKADPWKDFWSCRQRLTR